MGVASPGIPEADALLLIFRTNEEEEITDLITYTQHKMDNVSEANTVTCKPFPYTLYKTHASRLFFSSGYVEWIWMLALMLSFHSLRDVI